MKNERMTKSRLIAELNDLRRLIGEIFDLPAVTAGGADLRKMEAAHRSFREKEEKIRESFLQSLIPMCITTLKEGRFVYVSDAFLKRTELKREDVIGRTFAELHLIKEEQRAALLSALKKKETADIELQVKLRDGKLTDILLNTARVIIGKKSYLLTLIADITARKRAEELLRERESDLAEAQRLAKIGNWRIDKNTNEVKWSAELYRIFGVDEAVSADLYKALLRRIHPEDRTRVLRAHKKAEAQKGCFDLEYRVRTAAGQWRHIHDVGYTTQDANGKLAGLFGAAQDITEQKRREEALREEEKRFQAVADYTPGCENWFGPDGKLLWVNPMVFLFTGYTVEECLNMADYPQPIIDAADREEMSQLFKGAIKGSSGSNIECRIVCKDGRKKWGAVSWRPIYDKNGCNLGHRTSIRDITARKRMEDDLRNTKERLEAIVNTLPDLMFRVDQDGSIRECHSLDDELYYLHPSLFLGKKMADVLPAEAAKVIMTALDKAAERGISRGFVYSLPMRQGVCWYELSIAAMGKQARGKQDFIMLVRDITDRKRAEDELQKSNEKLETRVQKRTAELNKAVDNLKAQERLLSEESRRLQETNIALKVLLERREKDQQELEMKFLANVRSLVLPYVEKLQLTGLNAAQAGYVDVITTHLNNIISPFLRNLTASYMDLTPREIEVVNLVRDGKSAKEIALLLNSSVRSVEFHKDNIRRKLGLTHKKTNLRTYLLSLNKITP